jgi:hypothetical protein
MTGETVLRALAVAWHIKLLSLISVLIYLLNSVLLNSGSLIGISSLISIDADCQVEMVLSFNDAVEGAELSIVDEFNFSNCPKEVKTVNDRNIVANVFFMFIFFSFEI